MITTLAGAALLQPLAQVAHRMVGPRGCLLTFHRAATPELWERLPNRDFSIDDCYRDTFELVAPLFRRHNLPLTLFVTTGIPDGTASIWSIGLEDVLLERDEVLLDGERIKLGSSEERRAIYQRIAAKWDGSEAPRHYAAFCAANNVDINSLTSEAAFAELEGARVRLNERLGLNVAHFAFPYGRAADAGPRDFALAREAGFLSAATTRKGLVRGGQDQFSLPRNTINGSHRSVAAMEMHLLGLTGIAARIAGRV